MELIVIITAKTNLTQFLSPREKSELKSQRKSQSQKTEHEDACYKAEATVRRRFMALSTNEIIF